MTEVYLAKSDRDIAEMQERGGQNVRGSRSHEQSIPMYLQTPFLGSISPSQPLLLRTERRQSRQPFTSSIHGTVEKPLEITLLPRQTSQFETSKQLPITGLTSMQPSSSLTYPTQGRCSLSGSVTPLAFHTKTADVTVLIGLDYK